MVRHFAKTNSTTAEYWAEYELNQRVLRNQSYYNPVQPSVGEEKVDAVSQLKVYNRKENQKLQITVPAETLPIEEPKQLTLSQN